MFSETPKVSDETCRQELSIWEALDNHMVIIYRKISVESFEQFEATIVEADGKIKKHKILWSLYAVQRWAQREAGPHYREIFEWDPTAVVKPRGVPPLPRKKS